MDCDSHMSSFEFVSHGRMLTVDRFMHRVYTKCTITNSTLSIASGGGVKRNLHGKEQA